MAKKGGAKKRSPRQAPALTRRTWAKWIDFVKDHAKPEIFFVIWLTGALGLRCGEAVALRREDFGLDAEEPYVCAAGHTRGAKKSPGYIYVSRSNMRFRTRTLGKGLATTRSLGTKHGTRTREEEYMPPAKGYLFEARTGATKPHLNYIAVYYKIKELAPKFLQKLRADNAKHDPRISQLTPHSGRASFITHLMAQGYNLRMSMKQARHAPGSVKVHLRYGQLALTDVKTVVDKTDTAKAGLNDEATRDMTAKGLRRSVRLAQAELSRRGLS